MVKLKAGQKVFLEDGSRALIEEGDILIEAMDEKRFDREIATKDFTKVANESKLQKIKAEWKKYPVEEFQAVVRNSKELSDKIIDKVMGYGEGEYKGYYTINHTPESDSVLVVGLVVYKK